LLDDRNVRYLRNRLPLNCASDAPVVVKYVAPVPSGPTNVNGPLDELLAAAWKRTCVLAGTASVKLSVVQDVVPVPGLLSLTDEIRSPAAT